mmetsp:Transcript_7050/g.21750  ORF Transcript_7050/g.21750 Transcript_7050/m.21750 type:complete len:242 (+) Transcript_7050:539-1264(+)
MDTVVQGSDSRRRSRQDGYVVGGGVDVVVVGAFHQVPGAGTEEALPSVGYPSADDASGRANAEDIARDVDEAVGRLRKVSRGRSGLEEVLVQDVTAATVETTGGDGSVDVAEVVLRIQRVTHAAAAVQAVQFVDGGGFVVDFKGGVHVDDCGVAEEEVARENGLFAAPRQPSELARDDDGDLDFGEIHLALALAWPVLRDGPCVGYSLAEALLRHPVEARANGRVVADGASRFATLVFVDD